MNSGLGLRLPRLMRIISVEEHLTRRVPLSATLNSRD